MMASRFKIWRGLESHAKAMVEAMEAAARNTNFTDKDIEEWDDIYHALIGRPRLKVTEAAQMLKEEVEE